MKKIKMMISMQEQKEIDEKKKEDKRQKKIKKDAWYQEYKKRPEVKTKAQEAYEQKAQIKIDKEKAIKEEEQRYIDIQEEKRLKEKERLRRYASKPSSKLARRECSRRPENREKRKLQNKANYERTKEKYKLVNKINYQKRKEKLAEEKAKILMQTNI